MLSVETIKAMLSEMNEDAILFSDFDDALIGIGERPGMAPVAVYSRGACIEILMDSGMNFEDANNYFEFNVAQLWAGEHTPIVVIVPTFGI